MDYSRELGEMRDYSFRAVCNACGWFFEGNFPDENQRNARRNFVTAIILKHGYGYGGQKCPGGKGKKVYEVY
jgi:hypothetical protein